MLGALLGGSPDVIAIPEAQFTASLAPDAAATTGNLKDMIDAIEAHYRFRIWRYDLGGARPEGTGQFADAIRWLVQRYAADHDRTSPAFWVDHQPGHVREMAVLKEHFPQLKAIHVVRDGRAVAASLLPLNWGPNGIISASHFWANRTAMGTALRGFLGDDAWLEVHYEKLVTDTEAELRRICAFLGIEYRQAMAEGGAFNVPQFTQNQHALVGKKPDASRLEGWRKTLSKRDIEIFEAMAGPLLTYYGYTRDFPRNARLPGLAEKARITLADQVQAARKKRSFARQVEDHSG